MLELTPEQLSLLERLRSRGFQLVALPLYERAVGVRKGNCAALLAPAEAGGLKLVGEPSFLVEDNFSVRVHRGDRQWFVWKKKQVEATLERLEELEQFASELDDVLRPRV